VEGAVKYWVYLNGSLYVSSVENAVTVTERPSGTTYQVTVRALLKDGTFVTTPEAITVQTRVALSNESFSADVNSITLNWNVEGSTKTWIYFGTKSNHLVLYASSTTGTYTIPRLKPETQYYIQLAHLINGRIITEEDIYTVTTKSNELLNVQTRFTGNDLTISWLPNGESYKYWVTVTKGGVATTYSMTQTSYTIADFDPATDKVSVRGASNGYMYDYNPVKF
jgi:hypothetical protein